MNDYSFGNLLYELRTEKGLSQSELGEIFGVSNKAVSKWEMGASKPRPATLIDLASFFQISVEELLAGKRNENQTDVPIDYSAQEIRLRAEECNRSKRTKHMALFAFILITAVYITLGCIIIICGSEDAIIGPVLTLVAILADFIALIVFFVFYALQKQQKRNLYTLFPERTDEIRQLLTSKKNNADTESQSAKKWKHFNEFSFIVTFSLVISNITLQLTYNYLLTIIALVASIFVLGAISLIISKKAKNLQTKKKKALKISIACVCILSLLTLYTLIYINYTSIHRIDSDKVEKITVWVNRIDNEQELNTQDSEAFVKLYNQSKYNGKSGNDGDTSQYGINVYLTDGTILRLFNYGAFGRNFEISLEDTNEKEKDRFYVNNHDLREFVSKMVANAEK